MPLSSSNRLHLPTAHHRPVSVGVIGLIAMEESFACQMEAAGQEVPWEILIADRIGDSTAVRCDQVVADIDRLAKELAAEFAALCGG